MLHHLGLDGMQAPRAAQAFDADQLAPGEQADRQQTTIHRAKSRLAVHRPFDEHNRTSAAIAFGATFLAARESLGAQVLQQSLIRGNLRERLKLPVQGELKFSRHDAIRA